MKYLFLLASITNNAYANDIIMNYSHYDAHDNYWKVVPDIVICKNQTVYTKKQVEYVLGVWGEEFGNITTREKCNYDLEYGKIKIIDGKYLKPKQWGYTSYIYRNVKVNNKLVREHESALVQLDRNCNDMSLLIHEMGHAFGYNHYDYKKDVMNSTSRRTGSGKYPY